MDVRRKTNSRIRGDNLNYRVYVKGMHCKSCETLLRESLEENLGNKISVKKIDHKKGYIEINCNNLNNYLEKEIGKIVNSEGYSIEKIEKI